MTDGQPRPVEAAPLLSGFEEGFDSGLQALQSIRKEAKETGLTVQQGASNSAGLADAPVNTQEESSDVSIRTTS